MRFTKLHGIGNDYLFLDAFDDPSLARRDDFPALSSVMANRHTGVGADGIILIAPPTDSGARAGAAARMRMFNTDGSEGEMCGNGLRCAAKLLVDRAHVKAEVDVIDIETGAGVLTVTVDRGAGGKVERASVDMGEPILAPERIPVDVSKLEHAGKMRDADQWFVNDLIASFVSMGNPHMVTFLDDAPSRSSVERLGPECERHPAFPNRINVHLVHATSANEAMMRTWERGSGITLACGTGACAVLVAGVLTGRLGREALIHLPGGDLTIRWDEATNHVFKTGPATEVFSGEWPA